jgi:hypothetical protein
MFFLSTLSSRYETDFSFQGHGKSIDIWHVQPVLFCSTFFKKTGSLSKFSVKQLLVWDQSGSRPAELEALISVTKCLYLKNLPVEYCAHFNQDSNLAWHKSTSCLSAVYLQIGGFQGGAPPPSHLTTAPLLGPCCEALEDVLCEPSSDL